jgi:hypothetical protein
MKYQTGWQRQIWVKKFRRRALLVRHSTAALVTALARWRPATHRDPTTAAVLTAATALAQRVEFLEHQERDLTARLDALVQQINPALRAAYGVGPDTAAQLLVTAGTNTPAAHRGLLGCAVRGGAGPGILGQIHPPPTFPRR